MIDNIQPGATYRGEIIGGGIGYASTGSLGLTINLECEGGTISHTWYVTEKTAPRVKKNLMDLGAPEEMLQTEEGLDSLCSVFLVGKPVEFTTVLENYKGKERVRVQWVNPPRKAANQDAKPAAKLASLFGGKPATTNTPKSTTTQNGSGLGFARKPIPSETSSHVITDDDVPF